MKATPIAWVSDDHNQALSDQRAYVLQMALREKAADLCEGKATLHEQEIHTAETTQAASDDHINLLQHANAQLTADHWPLNDCFSGLTRHLIEIGDCLHLAVG